MAEAERVRRQGFRVGLAILSAAGLTFLVAASYPLWDIPECGTGTYALAPLRHSVLLMLIAFLASGVAAFYIGVAATVGVGLVATLGLVFAVVVAGQMGESVGTGLAGCGSDRFDAESVRGVIIMASSPGAVLGLLGGFVVGFAAGRVDPHYPRGWEQRMMDDIAVVHARWSIESEPEPHSPDATRPESSRPHPDDDA